MKDSVKRILIVIVRHEGGWPKVDLGGRGHPQLLRLVLQLSVDLHLHRVTRLLLLKSLVVNLKWRKQSGIASHYWVIIYKTEVDKYQSDFYIPALL